MSLASRLIKRINESGFSPNSKSIMGREKIQMNMTKEEARDIFKNAKIIRSNNTQNVIVRFDDDNAFFIRKDGSYDPVKSVDGTWYKIDPVNTDENIKYQCAMHKLWNELNLPH